MKNRGGTNYELKRIPRILALILSMRVSFIISCVFIFGCRNSPVIEKHSSIEDKISTLYSLLDHDFDIDKIEVRGDTLIITENFTDTTCFYETDFLAMKNQLIIHKINLNFPSDFKCLRITHHVNKHFSRNFFCSFDLLYKVKEAQKRDSSFVIPMTYFMRNFSCKEARELDGIYSYLASQNDSLAKYGNFVQLLVGLNKKHIQKNSIEVRIANSIEDAIEELQRDTSYYVFDSLAVHYPRLMNYY